MGVRTEVSCCEYFLRLVADEQSVNGDYRLKHFEHPELQRFRKFYLNPNFHNVFYIKPDSSRSASREGYWVCFGFKGVTGAGDKG